MIELIFTSVEVGRCVTQMNQNENLRVQVTSY